MLNNAPDLTLSGRFEPDQEKTYRPVPFEVPAAIEQLHLQVTYSERISSDQFVTGGNTLDVGLFDERGMESGSPGFRGWSGSNKLALTIATNWATPPYRPGRLGAGRWHVLLGAYKVGPRGLDYEIGIWFDPGISAPSSEEDQIEPESVGPLPDPIEPGWIRGDLHSHSTSSDGDSSTEELLRAARARGLDYLGITDHNASMLPVAPGIDDLPVLVPGIEVTSYRGHWNVWGADRWFDFRLTDPDEVAHEMKIARDSGGFVSMNHPKPFGPEWEYGFDLGYQAIEIWNGDWRKINAVSLGVWDVHLALGKRVVAMAGSDTHFLKNEIRNGIPAAQLGEPTTWVKPDNPRSATSILTALAAGQSFFSMEPDGPQILVDLVKDRVLRVRTRDAKGSALVVIAAGKAVGSAVIDQKDWEGTFSIPERYDHARAQIIDSAGNIEALSNVFWFEYI